MPNNDTDFIRTEGVGSDVVGGSHDVAFAGTLCRPVFVRVSNGQRGEACAPPR
jgi:hypothetical protein